MLRAYKYRLYPTPAQQKQIDETMNICRYVYNIGLETKIRAWQVAGVSLSAFDLQKQLTDAKKDFPWLRNAASNALDDALVNVEKAFKSFFRGNGYPKFKSKRGKQSFHCRNNLRRIDFDKGLLSICRIKDIPIVISKKFDGKIKIVTIVKTPTGKYHSSILVETSEKKPSAPSLKNAIGIDLGLSSFITISTGEKVECPKYFRKEIDRLRILNRRASRKKKRSKNQKKAFLKIALLHEKIVNQREDFLHNLSSKLIRNSQVDTICIESLRVDNLIKNRRLSLSISDAGWGKFIRMLEYKAGWYGKNVVSVGQFFPSSKTCSNCNNSVTELPLTIRHWHCEKCGATHDRDINAAINIRNQGLIISRRGTPVGPVELLSLERTLKQEKPLSNGLCQMISQEILPKINDLSNEQINKRLQQ